MTYEGIHGATIVTGGTVSDQATASELSTLATPGMYTGTPTADFTAMYRGQTVEYRTGVSFISDALQKAALAGQPITWSA
jgi:hypothetical protein